MALARFFGAPTEGDLRQGGRSVWLPVLAACLLAWLANLALRLIDLPVWQHPGLFVDGGHIMATHDAYYWLAAASGVRGTFNSQMHTLLQGISVFFGGDLVRAAFFGPALLAGFVGVAGVFWGRLLGGPKAMWIAGLLAGVAPGFFRRTRIGYYDSDLMTLLAPLLTVLLLAVLLQGVLRRSWRPAESGENLSSLVAEKMLFPAAFLFGLVARMGWWFHQDICNFGVAATLLGALLVLVAGRPGRRGEGLLALSTFMVTAFFGAPFFHARIHMFGAWNVLLGLAMAVALTLAARRFSLSGRGPLLTGVAALAAACLVANFLEGPALLIWSQLGPYLKPVADSAAGGAAGVTPPVYPAVAQSIIEAENVGILAVLMRLGPFSWLAPFGILGLIWVVLRRPAAVLLLPLLGLGLAGLKLGVRFTMFGGPAVAIGLAVPLAWGLEWAARRYSLRGWQTTATQLLLGLAVLVGLGFVYKQLPITPVIDRPHGEALTVLAKKAPEGSQVWTWWDYGYATQFYSGHMTPSDGGQHAGRYIYPTALALCSDSLRQSAGIIKYAAAHGGDPSPEWDRMGAEAAQALVESLRTEDVPAPAEPQYLVVPWAATHLSKWIGFFGFWRLDQGEDAKHFRYEHIRSAFRLDPDRGLLVPANGTPPVPVSSVDVLDGGGYKHHDFWRNVGAPHLVINQGQNDTYLMNDALYNSTLVRLLVCDPQDASIREHFELVVEGSPHVRVYRVR